MKKTIEGQSLRISKIAHKNIPRIDPFGVMDLSKGGISTDGYQMVFSDSLMDGIVKDTTNPLSNHSHTLTVQEPTLLTKLYEEEFPLERLAKQIKK